MGSLLSSGYADRMPEGAPAQARHSIAGAVADGDAGLVAAAREAFTASMATTTFTVSAIGVLAAALPATVVMRDDRRKPPVAEHLPPVAEHLPPVAEHLPPVAEHLPAVDRTAGKQPEPAV